VVPHRFSTAGVLVGHQQDAPGFRDLQRMEEHAVHPGEDCGVATEADGEGDNGRQREAAVLAQGPHRQLQSPSQRSTPSETDSRDCRCSFGGWRAGWR
jgi:hypothetical protein